MNIISQISSLEKVRADSLMDYREFENKTALKGEEFSYQISYRSDTETVCKVEMVSSLKKGVEVFCVKNAVMDCPAKDYDIDYITTVPGLMPDILVPLSESDDMILLSQRASSLWVDVKIPKDCVAGEYYIKIYLTKISENETSFISEKIMKINVIDEAVQKQSLIYTRWFYADCIADYHNVSVYSEEHWALIEKYIEKATEVGINMILVPIHTPPLDTDIGTKRTCVQLVDIRKENEKYYFGFEKFRRFIDICKSKGIKYFEMAHLFSQWGAKCAPNIMVEENGEKKYLFGWDVSSESEEYVEFLKQYMKALTNELKNENILENTYFHISDEPSVKTIDKYQKAYDIIKPLVGDAKTLDALSSYEFYERGLVKCPVTAIDKMSQFMEHNIENQWMYYSCVPQKTYCNSFMAMPSSRIRAAGFLMYKFNVKGFLHWGLNFYNGSVSRYRIDPYMTTSADGRYPSGDGFILYPSKDGAYASIRGKVTYEAIIDMNICKTLEKYTGRENVIKLIDAEAGMDVSFENYPKGQDYYIDLREKMIKMIENKITK